MEPSILFHVKNIIQAHLADDQFSVEALSRKAAISKPQLYRKLMADCGQSANHLIRDMRVEKAKTLLKDKDITIAEVAFATGFSDPDYFGKVFKKVVGMRPTEFKNISKMGINNFNPTEMFI